MRLMYLIIFIVWSGSLLALPECDWIDIPRGNYAEILGIPGAQIEELNHLVCTYHSIPKDLKKDLHKRIKTLTTISTYLKTLTCDERFAHQKPAILLLNTLLLKKQNYLTAVSEIPMDEEIAAYHLTAESVSGVQTLFMRNNRTYSIRMKEFWGEFWLESIDPCHRRLADYYQHWLDSNPGISDYFSFFLWMESQSIPKYVPVVRYFTDEEMDACHVQLADGYLTTRKDELLTTPSLKRNLYIIDVNKELYIETWRDGIWHTSLSRGKPVFGVGLLDVKSGVITRVAFESGHYLPSLQQGYQALQILIEKGARLNDPVEIIYFEERSKYKALVSSENLATYETFNHAIHNESKRELLSTNEF